ncbi:MAG TPA: thioredoxin family protein [bacterium]|jgi:thiol-disulfide isomerase/thioredoxin|nr:thioredoxin family protein [bacterium]
MTDRLAVLGLIALGFLLAALWLRFRLRALTVRLDTGVLAGLGLNGGPAVLSFTSPDCAACEAAQRPALQELRGKAGPRLQIHEVDAFSAPALVRALGIFSVPSTVVLDRGKVLAVNIGYATAARLLAQLPDGAP